MEVEQFVRGSGAGQPTSGVDARGCRAGRLGGGGRVLRARRGGRPRPDRPPRAGRTTTSGSGARSTTTSPTMGRRRILLTCAWHARSASDRRPLAGLARLGARIRAKDARARRVHDAFAAGDPLAGRRRGGDAGRRGGALCSPRMPRSPGDVLIGTPGGGVRVSPDSWLDGRTTPRSSGMDYDRCSSCADRTAPAHARRRCAARESLEQALDLA